LIIIYKPAIKLILCFRREEARQKELEDLQRQQELLRAQIEGVPVSGKCCTCADNFDVLLMFCKL